MSILDIFSLAASVYLAVKACRWLRRELRHLKAVMSDRPFDVAPPEPADEPEIRYFVTRPSVGWHAYEITKQVYIRIEHEFGWRRGRERDPWEPVTRWFHDRNTVSAWTTRDGDRGDAPVYFNHRTDAGFLWTDPTTAQIPDAHRQAVKDLHTSAPAHVDDGDPGEEPARPPDRWPWAAGDFGQARSF